MLINFSAEVMEVLRTEAKQQGVSPAALVNRVIANYTQILTQEDITDARTNRTNPRS